MHPVFDEEKPLSLGLANRDESQVAEENREEAKHEILMGSIWCVIGVALIIAIAKMSNGSGFIIPLGPILFGGIKLFRGLSNYPPSPEK